MGLEDRGVVREGAWADIAVLNLEDVRDPAKFRDPHQYATGARHVFVNDVLVLHDGTMTGARPGHALKKNAPSR